MLIRSLGFQIVFAEIGFLLENVIVKVRLNCEIQTHSIFPRVAVKATFTRASWQSLWLGQRHTVNKSLSTGSSNDGKSGFTIWSFRGLRQVARKDRESGLLIFKKCVCLVVCLFVNSSYLRKYFSPLGQGKNTLRSGQVCFVFCFYFWPAAEVLQCVLYVST